MSIIQTIVSVLTGEKVVARFNPTGTHEQHGYWKLRFDFYPRVTDKTYALHHIEVPVIPKEGYPGLVDEEGPVDPWAFDIWIESLPKAWQLNPFICHFIKIGPGDTPETVTAYLKDMFQKDTIKAVDMKLAVGDESWRPLMESRTRTPLAERKPGFNVDAANNVFANLEVEIGD